MKTKFIEATLMPEVDKYHFDLRIKRKTKKKKNQVNGNSYPQNYISMKKRNTPDA